MAETALIGQGVTQAEQAKQIKPPFEKGDKIMIKEDDFYLSKFYRGYHSYIFEVRGCFMGLARVNPVWLVEIQTERGNPVIGLIKDQIYFAASWFFKVN